MNNVNRFGMTTLGIAIAFGSGLSIAHAQTPISPPPPGMPTNIAPVSRDAQRVLKLAAELSLNQSQSVQILGIMKMTHVRERQVRSNTTWTPAQKQYNLRIVKRIQHVQIAAVLTSAQRMRFVQIDRGI
jgi:hypothetical protein